MALRVVDGLEVVDIDVQQRQAILMALCQKELVLKSVLECSAVKPRKSS